MEESRKKLKEVVQLLDKKEKSCREIIEQSLELPDSFRNGGEERMPASSDNQYGNVIEMFGQGLAEQEISRLTGLTEGEIGLIIDLHRSTKENK